MKPPKDHQGVAFTALIVTITIIIGLCLAGRYIYIRHHSQINPSQSKQQVSSKALMSVSYVGGLCANGNICSSTENIFNDGTFENHTKLSSAEVARLKGVIKTTDFSAYTPEPKPNCPSFADGSDEVLSFPQKYGNKSFTLCKLKIPQNDTVIVYINNLVDSHSRD